MSTLVMFTPTTAGILLHPRRASSITKENGNVVLEAQASGLPVIVTDQGGPVQNIIPQKTGLVVKADCVQSIVNAMASLVVAPR